MSTKPLIQNVLAERYASTAMLNIWSRESKILLERKFWISVMRGQSKNGVDISQEDIASYEAVIEKIDLKSIDEREAHLRHDVKARIEEFNSLAGRQLIHLGMTSRDLTENVELLQIKTSLALIQDQTLAILHLFAEKIEQYSDLVMVGRSHNVPAQLTTLGKRLASTAEELLFAYERVSSLVERLPLKGLRGPVGTGQDLADLVGIDAAGAIESQICSDLGFSRVLDSTGQVYFRSLDFEVISTLVQLSAAPTSLATTIRLMSGAGLVSEGFKEGQVGSSAMPHKINARSSERINGLSVVLKGYLSMVSELAGDQWNEGDVSCSVVRRVTLSDSFFAMDGIYQTLAAVLDELVVHKSQILREVERELPFTVTTHLLMEAVKKGLGREDAHKIIQRHSLSALETTRSGKDHAFIQDLAADEEFPLNMGELDRLISTSDSLLSNAKQQATSLVNRIRKLPNPSVQFESIR